MVEIANEYAFAGPGGQAGLPDLSGGRRQLIAYHFMWRHEESASQARIRAARPSSLGSDFNYDFHVSLDENVAPLQYNYKDKTTLERELPYIQSGRDCESAP